MTGKPPSDSTLAVNEQAKLEALIADPSTGEAASVLREVARLSLDNLHLKRVNVRVWSITAILAVSMLVIIGTGFFWFPRYRYIATMDNRAVCELSATETGAVTPAGITEFAKEAALASYSYDYVNYRATINDVTSRFYTEAGRKALLGSLDTSGNLERVVKGRLIMRTFATNAPQIETDGMEGAARFWLVHVPIAIEFYSGASTSPTNVQDYLAIVKVVQDNRPSAANPKGINVDSMILNPMVRRR